MSGRYIAHWSGVVLSAIDTAPPHSPRYFEMPTPPLALDLSRLALAPVSRVPRGIDRVELAYARHFLNNWPGDCLAVLPMPWGVRCYDRTRALRFLRVVESLWRESIHPSQDTYFERTKAFLAGTSGAPMQHTKLKSTLAERTCRFAKLLFGAGFTTGRSVTRFVPPGTIYLNVGQTEVFRPTLTWLHRRSDIRTVLMIHDVIPLELPDLHLPIGVRFHHSIVRNTAEFARAMIVPSNAAGQAILQEVRKYRKAELPTHVELLPVPSEFLTRAPEDAELSKSNFFIICGALDAHKNHLMLLDVWTKLVARHGAKAPKLVVVGTAGVTSGPALDCFARSNSLHGCVAIVTGLSTPALRQFVAHARALLMPSLAEGFGLPIVEALAQHTPVVASDIPAHREAGAGGDVIYLEPTDTEAWLGCIEQLATTSRARSKLEYRPKTWANYFAGIENFLFSLER